MSLESGDLAEQEVPKVTLSNHIVQGFRIGFVCRIRREMESQHQIMSSIPFECGSLESDGGGGDGVGVSKGN